MDGPVLDGPVWMALLGWPCLDGAPGPVLSRSKPAHGLPEWSLWLPCLVLHYSGLLVPVRFFGSCSVLENRDGPAPEPGLEKAFLGKLGKPLRSFPSYLCPLPPLQLLLAPCGASAIAASSAAATAPASAADTSGDDASAAAGASPAVADALARLRRSLCPSATPVLVSEARAGASAAERMVAA